MQHKDDRRALVVTNGYNDTEFLKKIHSMYDLIISADGAANKLHRAGIKPDIMVGDFDSIDERVLKRYSEMGVELVRLRPDKDFSDTQISIEEAHGRGYCNIDLVGAFGSRWDHSIGNLNLLFWAYKNNISLRLIAPTNSILYCGQGEHTFEPKVNHYWSCLALFEDALVDIVDMKYSGMDVLIKQGESIGLSNEFLECEGKLNIKKGSILVVQSLMDR